VYAEDPAFVARAIAIRNVHRPFAQDEKRCLNLWRSDARSGIQPAR
jgi:hypothetical protein